MSPTKLHIDAEKEAKKQKKEIANNGFMQKLNMWVIMHSKVKAKEMAVFFRLLATMINAGLHIVKSLEILIEQIENPKLKKITEEILHRIEKGENFSKALADYPDLFTEAQTGMIYAGEQSGQLNKVLLQLADQIEKSASLSGKIKGAMIYPAVILVVLLAVGILVMVLVIPKITELFESAEVQLPFLTRVLIGMSDFLIGSTFGIPHWGLVILGLVLFVALLNMWKKTDQGKLIWDKMMLKLPVFGKMNQKVALAKFCRGLSSMTTSGISIIKSLKIVSDTVGNEVYKRRIYLIAFDVKKGITIADNIQEDKKLFPAMVVSMIGVGEKTAQLDKVCAKVAEFYEDEVDSMVANLSKLMEPIIIVVIGTAAGLMVAAVMLPIMQIAEVASQGT